MSIADAPVFTMLLAKLSMTAPAFKYAGSFLSGETFLNRIDKAGFYMG